MWKSYLCDDVQAWDNSIFSHSKLSPFLLYGWSDVIQNSYGHRPYFLAFPAEVTKDTSYRAVLPLVHFHGPGGPGRLVSLPYIDYAGMYADDRHAAAELLVAAFALAEELQVKHLELRQDTFYPLPEGVEADSNWRKESFTFKVGLRRTLPGSAEMLWQQLGSKVRNQVRKARKNGCVFRLGGAEFLDAFYTVFTTNMRDLCSPVHAYSFFTELLSQFADAVRIILVEREEKVLASSIVIRNGDTLYNPWASSLRPYRPLCPNMLLYWAMLSCACDQGMACFDFGRSSPGASTYRFKKQWGAESRPLSWEIFSLPGYEWRPQNESLNLQGWDSLSVEEASEMGPQMRRWISL